MNIEQLEELYNQLYTFAVDAKFKDLLATAEHTFVQNDDQSDTEGFAEWFIFNYRAPQSGERIIDQFIPSDNGEDTVTLLKAIKRSVRSLYEVRFEHEKAAFKDVFSGEDFIIENFMIGDGVLASARLVTLEDKHYLIGDIFELELQYKDSIKKYVLDQYNQYTVAHGPTSLNDFFDLNGHLIYKVMGIVQSISEENAYDDVLLLHQATYAYKCSQDALYDLLMALEVPIYADDEDDQILRVMDEDSVLAEIEITNGMFYILCNDESHLKTMLALMKPILNENVVFVKTDTFTLEDML